MNIYFKCITSIKTNAIKLLATSEAPLEGCELEVASDGSQTPYSSDLQELSGWVELADGWTQESWQARVRSDPRGIQASLPGCSEAFVTERSQASIEAAIPIEELS